MYSVRVRDLASGTIVRSVTLGAAPSRVISTDDGSRIAVQLFYEDIGLYQFFRVDFGAGSIAALTDDPDSVFEAAYSPDGQWLAYTTESGQLRLVNPTTGERREVGDAEGSIAFSPDGSRIAFQAAGDTGSDIWFYEMQSAQLTRVPAEASAVLERSQPRFSIAGTSLAYFVELADASTTVTRVRNLENGQTFDIDREEDDLHWSADGSLVIVDDEDITQVGMPGQFSFPAIGLEAGVNLFSAIATDEAGNTSLPALPIALTLNLGDLADLAVQAQDVFIYPLIPAPGESVRISATVRNTGQAPATGVTVAFFDIDEQGLTTQMGSAQSVGTIAVAGQASASVQWVAVAGRRRIMVRVDPYAAIRETSESNNSADRPIDVIAPGVPAVRLSLDRTSYQPADTVRIAASAINPATAADFVLQVTIEDELGNLAATVLDRALTGFSYATHEATPSWPTSGVFAGAYRVRATLRRADGFTVSATAPFSIVAVEHVSAALATDKSTYLVGEMAQLTGVVRNQSANVVVENLAASIRIRDAAGTETTIADTPIGTLLLGAQAQAAAAWRTLAPGAYTSTITVRRGTQQVAEASRSFTVSGVVQVAGHRGAGVGAHRPRPQHADRFHGREHRQHRG